MAWIERNIRAGNAPSVIAVSLFDAAFLCRFEWTVRFKLGKGDTLLEGRRPMERNQIRFLLFMVNPHDEEHPTSTSELNSFTHMRNVHRPPWEISYVKHFTMCCA